MRIQITNGWLLALQQLPARALVVIALSAIAVALGACGSGGDNGMQPSLVTATPTATAAPTATDTPSDTSTPGFTQRYSIQGIVNGNVAQGEITLAHAGGGPNLVRYTVLYFTLDTLRGSGSAEWLTIGRYLSMSLTVSLPEQDPVEINGMGASGRFPNSIADFTLTGPGFTVIILSSQLMAVSEQSQ